MRKSSLGFVLASACLGWFPASVGAVSTMVISDTYFPAPEGTRQVEFFNGGLEAQRGPDVAWGWQVDGANKRVEGDAPEGKAYLQVPAKGGRHLYSPEVMLEPGETYFFSFFVKSTVSTKGYFGGDAEKQNHNLLGSGLSYIGANVPDTEGKWQRVGYFFRASADAVNYKWIMYAPTEPESEICLDDFRLRTATNEEYRREYDKWRGGFPRHDLSPRPDDGQNLALAISKLEGRGIPGKPFVIWAVGASWTNMLGVGETLITEIQRRYPNAPKILYRKHVGSGSPYEYVRGWVHQFVIAEQPDLVLCYTNGSSDALDAMLQDIKANSTADVIIPSQHFLFNEQPDEATTNSDYWNTNREICRKHGVEFVENRREWAEYLTQNNLKTSDLREPNDGLHQNSHGALLINENIARHFARCPNPAYQPESRERFVPLQDQVVKFDLLKPHKADGKDKVTLSREWSLREDQGSLATLARDAKITVEFTGNRLDLIGFKSRNGGTVTVFVDGKPAGQTPVFYTNFIDMHPARFGVFTDYAPHCVLLGNNVIPQRWIIQMTNADGDYTLTGSATGADGSGNWKEMFTSSSGQISIDPAIWRQRERFTRPAGYQFKFDVFRCAVDTVSFKSENMDGSIFSVPLVQHLPNGKHTVTVIGNGNGDVSVLGFWVYEPSLK